jgi:hypothetical protein
MAGDLILMPVRVWFRVTRFAVRSGIHATEQALALASHAIRSVTPDGSAEAPERWAPNGAARSAPADVVADDEPSVSTELVEEEPGESADSAVQDAPPRRAAAADAPAPPEPSLRAEPVHVSEEPTVVEEFAEPGAEDGAGAQVTVAEPWDGYKHMNARDVIARLADASPEELAAVELYENLHRQRDTVITAAERELRSKSGRGAATADQSRKEHPDAQ